MWTRGRSCVSMAMSDLSALIGVDLPEPAGLCVGRVLRRDGASSRPVPVVALIRPDFAYDLSSVATTMSDLLDGLGALDAVDTRRLTPIVDTPTLLANSLHRPTIEAGPRLLCPTDLQPVKGCGVTFAGNALNRALDTWAARTGLERDAIRLDLEHEVGSLLGQVEPATRAADRLRAAMTKAGQWSDYLEVAFGPLPEVFHKAYPMAAVGFGSYVGFRSASAWHQSEPEVVLVLDGRQRIVGATLGNDTDLRDLEERSAYLVAQSKDNNASTALGPWIRLFDEGFSLDDLLGTAVEMRVRGTDGFDAVGGYDLRSLTRDAEWLVEHVTSATHQYPDGLALLLGCGWVPTADRLGAGKGFTHLEDDLVVVSNPSLGSLINRTGVSERLPRWDYGIRSLWQDVLGSRSQAAGRSGS